MPYFHGAELNFPTQKKQDPKARYMVDTQTFRRWIDAYFYAKAIAEQTGIPVTIYTAKRWKPRETINPITKKSENTKKNILFYHSRKAIQDLDLQRDTAKEV